MKRRRIQVWIDEERYGLYEKEANSLNLPTDTYIKLVLEERIDEFKIILDAIAKMEKGTKFLIANLCKDLKLKFDKEILAGYGKIILNIKERLNITCIGKDNIARSNIWIKL